MRGRKDEDKQDKQQLTEQWRRTMQAEFERLDALPLTELAAEVTTKVFGPGGPGADEDANTSGREHFLIGPTARSISFQFLPDRAFSFQTPTPEDNKLRERLVRLVAEGLQQLEHASLVRCQLHTTSGPLDWVSTRRGRAALARGEIRDSLQAASTPAVNWTVRDSLGT
jgi:hypothetical protein